MMLSEIRCVSPLKDTFTKPSIHIYSPDFSTIIIQINVISMLKKVFSPSVHFLFQKYTPPNVEIQFNKPKTFEFRTDFVLITSRNLHPFICSKSPKLKLNIGSCSSGYKKFSK